MRRLQSRRQRMSGGAASLALVAVMTVGVTPVGADSRTASDTIAGSIQLNGCTLGPAALTLRAQAITSGAQTADATEPARRPKPKQGRNAIVRATRDPHLLTFRIDDLRAGELYHLTIRDEATNGGESFGECGRLFWRGPFEGLAQAGGPPIAIEGFAARTQLEVMRPSADSWHGSDQLDLADPASSVRSIRWRTSLPAVQAGELQISTEPFPIVGDDGSSCAEPPGGIVYRKQVQTAEQEWIQLDEIDLASALAPPRTTDSRVDTTDAIAGDGPVAQMTPEKYASLLSGAPLWLRVVPIRETGPACDLVADGVHGWVNLAKIVYDLLNDPPESPDPPSLALAGEQRYDAPFFDPQGRPKGDQYSYVVTQPHQLPSKTQAYNIFDFSDPVGAMLVRDHPSMASTWMYPGNYIIIDPGEPSWWDNLTDSVGSLVTGAIDAIGFLVDKVSKAYADIKAAAIKVATDVVTALPVVKQACDVVGTETCRAAIEAGVDAGLASMGMPPSLPNWNELQDVGADYLAAEIASQTGVPEVLTEKAVELGVDAMNRLSANRGGKATEYHWLAPYFGFDPAVAYVSLHKDGGDLPPLLALEFRESSLFEAQTVVLPRHWTGSDLVVPVVLTPNVQDISGPTCYDLFHTFEVPCGDAYTTRWFRNAYRSKIESATCGSLQMITQQYTFTGGIPPLHKGYPVASLQVFLFAQLDEPTWNYAWSGKYFGVCT